MSFKPQLRGPSKEDRPAEQISVCSFGLTLHLHDCVALLFHARSLERHSLSRAENCRQDATANRVVAVCSSRGVSQRQLEQLREWGDEFFPRFDKHYTSVAFTITMCLGSHREMRNVSPASGPTLLRRPLLTTIEDPFTGNATTAYRNLEVGQRLPIHVCSLFQMDSP